MQNNSMIILHNLKYFKIILHQNKKQNSIITEQQVSSVQHLIHLTMGSQAEICGAV
jgi:hypothetical protein